MKKHGLAAFALLFAAGCVSSPVRKEDMVAEGIVFPIGMCARRGTVVTSNDDPGTKMFCEQIEPVGSHVPQCICWDEQMVAKNREEAQQAMRELE
jgi:hypothetical protein